MLGPEPCSSFQAAAGLLLLTGMQCLIAGGRSIQHHGVAAKLAADDSDRADERSAAQHRLHQWRNVLDARNTWFFDLGSNAGWKLQETAGQRHAFVGPAPVERTPRSMSGTRSPSICGKGCNTSAEDRTCFVLYGAGGQDLPQ